jgi:hypothetical protein
VIVAGGVTGRQVGTAYIASLPPPVVREKGDGSGDIGFGSLSFGADTVNRLRTGSFLLPEPLMPPRFRDIPEVLHVRDLIVAGQAAAHQR